MFTSRPIGFIRSPYNNTTQVPRGLGAQHNVEGVLEILPEFSLGLQDIDGFSHLIVLWEFDRSDTFELIGTSPADHREHGVFATRSPRRPNPIGLTVVELIRRDGAELRVHGVDMLDGRRFSISSRTCRALPKRSCAGAGSRRPRRDEMPLPTEVREPCRASHDANGQGGRRNVACAACCGPPLYGWHQNSDWTGCEQIGAMRGEKRKSLVREAASCRPRIR
jgi:tRNA (adenine37-N6)-methyltransferase